MDVRIVLGSAFAAAVLALTVPAAAQTFLSGEEVAKSIAKRPILCIAQDEAGSCAMVGHAISVTAKQISMVVVMLDGQSGLKFVIAQEWDVERDQVCWEVPNAGDIKFDYYRAGNEIGDISSKDVLVPLTAEKRAQILPSITLMLGRVGDELCDKYQVYDMVGGEVTAHMATSFKNGEKELGSENYVVRYYPAGTELVLYSLT